MHALFQYPFFAGHLVVVVSKRFGEYKKRKAHVASALPRLTQNTGSLFFCVHTLNWPKPSMSSVTSATSEAAPNLPPTLRRHHWPFPTLPSQNLLHRRQQGLDAMPAPSYQPRPTDPYNLEESAEVMEMVQAEFEAAVAARARKEAAAAAEVRRRAEEELDGFYDQRTDEVNRIHLLRGQRKSVSVCFQWLVGFRFVQGRATLGST